MCVSVQDTEVDSRRIVMEVSRCLFRDSRSTSTSFEYEYIHNIPGIYWCVWFVCVCVQDTEVAPVAAAEVLSAGPELRVLLRLFQAGEKRGIIRTAVYLVPRTRRLLVLEYDPCLFCEELFYGKYVG